MQELDPNALPAAQRRRRALTDASADVPAPQRPRRTRQPPVTPTFDVLEDPPVDPPVVRPVGFLSRLRPAPQYTLGPLTARCTACNALHFQSTDGIFEPCYKKGDVILPPIRKPPEYLYALLTGDDPRCHAFRAHFRAYNYAFTFTSVSYKKDARIDPATSRIQCFQIHGQLFHYHGPLQPASHEVPSFTQLFFYNPAYVTDIRANQYL